MSISLLLIGTGISFDLTVFAIDELRKSDEIYLESYTFPIEEEKIRSLEKSIGKKIRVLARLDVESDFLIKRAKEAKVVLLIGGDPLTATTHISLLIDAKKLNISTKIIHNSSIYTAAAGYAGLQIYKFGKTATIPYPKNNYNPTSWFSIIKKNLEINAHTLVLLDTEPKPMDAKTALTLIENTDKEKVLKDKKIVVLSNLGSEVEKISYGTLEDLKSTDPGKPPLCIVIPAKLHIVEQEYLDLLKS